MKKPLTPEEKTQIEATRAAAAGGDWYALLGVHPTCRLEDVETAYRELARAWHPDRFYSRDTGDLADVMEENFAAITRAHRLLRDPSKRAEYDRELIATGRMPSTPAPEQRGHEVRFVSVPPPERPPSRPPPEPPKPRAPPAIQKIQSAIAEQLARARAYYDAGKADYDAGQFGKAESALYLATKFDPRNEAYQRLWKEAAGKAAENRARLYVQQAEAAEESMHVKEAMALYRKAVDCDPPEGVAFYRLAKLVQSQEDDARGALALYRKAALKEPRNATYRLVLAEMYAAQDMHVNALREVQAVLEADPKHEKAKVLFRSLRK